MLPAGTYYVGDLCYVMHDKWDQFCDATISGERVLNGEFKIGDVIVASYCTKYGDGVYRDQEGRRYGVDAGLIGCIRIDQIHPSEVRNVCDGNVITFDRAFQSGVTEEGVIWFGDVKIETGDTSYNDEDEDDYYEDEDNEEDV